MSVRSPPPYDSNLDRQVASHHFGFGALALENLNATSRSNLMTGLRPSNKFKESLIVK